MVAGLRNQIVIDKAGIQGCGLFSCVKTVELHYGEPSLYVALGMVAS
jgi:hypothetical protein